MSIKLNPKNAHQFSTIIKNDKEVKVIYTHSHYQKALREEMIRDAQDGK